jgi:hypothetical protein
VATTRIDWPDLPASARALVEKHVGQVGDFRTIGTGLNSEIATVLDTVTSRVFLKGVPLARKTLAACQRREAAVNPAVLAVRLEPPGVRVRRLAQRRLPARFARPGCDR